MKGTGIFLVFITVFILSFPVLFSKNLGEHTPVWEAKERLFGEEYLEMRSEYFLSEKMRMLWHNPDDIFDIQIWGSAFTTKKVCLKVEKEVADNCEIDIYGDIEWKRDDLDVSIRANALTDEPLKVRRGGDEYNLDKTEDSIQEFEAATGIRADELLDTVALIRNAYRDALNERSRLEYQKICAKIEKAVVRLATMWEIYLLIWVTDRAVRKKYQRDVDESMKDYL